jgi:hypothetical protein
MTNTFAARTNSYRPSVGVRLLWWFGIFLAAQLPLIPLILWIHCNSGRIWFVFPMGLEWPFFLLTAWLVPQPDPTTSFAQNLHYAYRIIMMVFPWAIYAVHLFLSLCIRERRHFLILMWILGAIVLLNLASCACFLYAPPQ